jgi:hypothetical protein
MAKKDNLRLGELFGVAPPRRTGGRGRSVTYEEPPPLFTPVVSSTPRTPGESQRLIENTRQLLQSAATGVPAQPVTPTPGGAGFYLGGSIPSQTQDQGLANIQNAYAKGQLPVPPSEYIPMRQQAMREAMQSGQPMVVSGEFPGMVMIGGEPRGGITSAPIDGSGGFDPATARVAKAYNERINQMVAEGKTPTREEQVALQRGLVQQERDAQASFEDRFERARTAGLAAGGGAGDPEANARRYLENLRAMSGVADARTPAEAINAMGTRARFEQRQRDKAMGQAEARAAREGKLTPQQQMAEAERERQSKERIAGMRGEQTSAVRPSELTQEQQTSQSNYLRSFTGLGTTQAQALTDQLNPNKNPNYNSLKPEDKNAIQQAINVFKSEDYKVFAKDMSTMLATDDEQRQQFTDAMNKLKTPSEKATYILELFNQFQTRTRPEGF